MQKRVYLLFLKSASLSQIFLLISMTFAFAILLAWASPSVSADDDVLSTPGSAAADRVSKEGVGSAAAPGAGAAQTFTKNAAQNAQSGGGTRLIGPSAANSPIGSASAVTKWTNTISIPKDASVLTTTGEKIAQSNIAKLEYSSSSGNFKLIDAKGNSLGESTITDLNTAGATHAGGYNGVDIPMLGKVWANTPVMGHLTQGLMWSVMVVGVIQLIGGIAGFDKGLTNALTYSAVGGIMAGKMVYGAVQQGWIGSTTGGQSTLFGANAGTVSLGIGAAAAIIIFVLTYKKTKTKTVSYQCLPWEPPLGGQFCEDCNKYPDKPCSEYRCKALGQACQLLNPGTGQELCTKVSRNDVNSPAITPWDFALQPRGLKYTPLPAIRPSALGTRIVSSGGGCLPPFTPLEFGFTTNEPAQCKVELNHTTNYGSMNEIYVGDSNYYAYNHTQKMRLPGPPTAEEVAAGPTLQNDGTFNLYVRCQDANGNSNDDEYVFTFCVDKSPDTTQPVIENFSIASGSPITYNQNSVNMEVYVNEPADCKWSRENKNYAEMENTMSCSSQTYQVNADIQYTCRGNLTGIKNRESSTFYFRCKDQPGQLENVRNTNTVSKELVIRGSEPLYVTRVAPNGTIYGSTDVVQLNLEVDTSNGADEGIALCFFSPSGIKDSYTPMFETDSYIHKQSLSLEDGRYNYFIRCVDAGGNAAEANTTFSVVVDKQTPKVTRVYRQDGLKITTDEAAECTYSTTSCNFKFEEGIKMIYSNPDSTRTHYTDWKPSEIYYIKCRDGYGNLPEPNKCSVIASAVELTAQVY